MQRVTNGSPDGSGRVRFHLLSRSTTQVAADATCGAQDLRKRHRTCHHDPEDDGEPESSCEVKWLARTDVLNYQDCHDYYGPGGGPDGDTLNELHDSPHAGISLRAVMLHRAAGRSRYRGPLPSVAQRPRSRCHVSRATFRPLTRYPRAAASSNTARVCTAASRQENRCASARPRPTRSSRRDGSPRTRATAPAMSP